MAPLCHPLRPQQAGPLQSLPPRQCKQANSFPTSLGKAGSSLLVRASMSGAAICTIRQPPTSSRPVPKTHTKALRTASVRAPKTPRIRTARCSFVGSRPVSASYAVARCQQDDGALATISGPESTGPTWAPARFLPFATVQSTRSRTLRLTGQRLACQFRNDRRHGDADDVLAQKLSMAGPAFSEATAFPPRRSSRARRPPQRP